MAYRKAMSVSVPPPLAKEVEHLAKRQHQSVSELVRAALRQYLDVVEQEAAWKRARAYGQRRARTLGIRTERQLQAILDELRHGREPVGDESARRR